MIGHHVWGGGFIEIYLTCLTLESSSRVTPMLQVIGNKVMLGKYVSACDVPINNGEHN